VLNLIYSQEIIIYSHLITFICIILIIPQHVPHGCTRIHPYTPICTHMHLHAPSCTHMHPVTPARTRMHLYAPTYTYHTPTIHLHAPVCTHMRLHPPTCIYMHLYAPICIYMHPWKLSDQLIQLTLIIRTMMSRYKSV
jgi:hypothetical protein